MKSALPSNQRTVQPTAESTTEQWYLIDAKGIVLGRLATRVATLLRGKHQPTFAPHLPTGNQVIVVNAAQVKVTGHKLADKHYQRHSTRPGSMKQRSLADELQRHPHRPIERAVYGMLPNNRLRSVWMNHLHVYVETTHPHQAQQPTEVKLDG